MSKIEKQPLTTHQALGIILPAPMLPCLNRMKMACSIKFIEISAGFTGKKPPKTPHQRLQRQLGAVLCFFEAYFKKATPEAFAKMIEPNSKTPTNYSEKRGLGAKKKK